MALNDRQMRFVLEYLLDSNAPRAMIAAGYSEKYNEERLTHHPEVKALIAKHHKKQREEFEIEAKEILWYLWACATRDVAKYFDGKHKGRLLMSVEALDELPEREKAAVNGLKQKVLSTKVTVGDEETITEEIIETEIKLVPREVALRLAMEHKGLFQPHQTEIKLGFNLDSLYGTDPNTIDLVEKRLLDEQKTLDGKGGE